MNSWGGEGEPDWFSARQGYTKSVKTIIGAVKTGDDVSNTAV